MATSRTRPASGAGRVTRRLGVDLAIAVVVGVAIQIAIQTASEPDSRAPAVAGHLIGVLMAVPFVVVRRRPVAVSYVVAAILIGYYSSHFRGFPPTIALIVPLYFAAARGQVRAVLPVPVFFMAAAVVVGVRRGQGGLDLVNALLPHIALVTVAALLGALVKSRRTLADETTERLRLAAEAMRRAAEDHDREARRKVAEERLRLAQELHDTLSHAIATMTVQSGGALQVLDTRPDLVRDALDAIRGTGREALEELRATLGLLRMGDESTAATDRSAGLDRLPALVDAVRAAGLAVNVEVTGAGTLPPAVDHTAYRILQEALTNVLRHARPDATATVHVRHDADAVTIAILDDGVGAPPDGSASTVEAGNGLRGMRERAAALGGTVEAGPGEHGFSVRARLPIGSVR